jgi:hypothetical protein
MGCYHSISWPCSWNQLALGLGIGITLRADSRSNESTAEGDEQCGAIRGAADRQPCGQLRERFAVREEGVCAAETGPREATVIAEVRQLKVKAREIVSRLQE